MTYEERKEYYADLYDCPFIKTQAPEDCIKSIKKDGLWVMKFMENPLPAFNILGSDDRVKVVQDLDKYTEWLVDECKHDFIDRIVKDPNGSIPAALIPYMMGEKTARALENCGVDIKGHLEKNDRPIVIETLKQYRLKQTKTHERKSNGDIDL